MLRKTRLADLSAFTTAAVTLIALIATPIAADEFHMTNGNIIRGAIQSETSDRYAVQTLQGVVNLSKADVRRHVSDGSTPLEIQGDVAASKGDTTNAVTAWQQAMTSADEGSIAAARLQEKIDQATAAAETEKTVTVQNMLNQARGLMESQQLEAAQAVLDRLQVRNITDQAVAQQIQQLVAQVHYARGLGARDNVRLELARQEFEAAIAANPNFYPAYLDLGEMLVDNSASAGLGLERLTEGLRIGGDQVAEPRRYEIIYKMAQRYFDTGNYSEAAAAFALLIPARDRYPAYADALDKAVDAYVRTGEQNMTSDFNQTITTLNSALQLNPNNEKALFLLGRIYQDMGQLENAIITLERLAQINPSYPEVNLYLGRAYNRLHDHQTALRYLTREVGFNGNNIAARLARAEASINLGRYTEAEQDLATARVLDSENWRMFYLSGLLEFNRNDYAAAQEQLSQAVRANRSAIPAMLLMGRVLDARNQDDGAREWLTRVVERLEREPELGVTYRRYLSEALTRLGEMAVNDSSPRQAEEYLAKALQIDPSYPLALSASGDALLLMSRDSFATSPEVLVTRAEQLYLRAIQLEPNEPIHYLKLGQYYQLHGNNLELARENFNLYVDKGGRDPEVNSLLAAAGGVPREEINEAVRQAAQAVAQQPGTAFTTATASITTGTVEPQTGQVMAEAQTITTTVTNMAPVLNAMNQAEQAVNNQTTGTPTPLQPLAVIPTPGIMPPPPAANQFTTGTATPMQL